MAGLEAAGHADYERTRCSNRERQRAYRAARSALSRQCFAIERREPRVYG